MAKEKKIAEEQVEEIKDQKNKLTLQVDIPDKPEFVICKVCGHKNTGDAGLCVMCSNYLF